MHMLVFVIGDDPTAQLEAQMGKHIDAYGTGGRWSKWLPERQPDGSVEFVDALDVGNIAWDAVEQLTPFAMIIDGEWIEEPLGLPPDDHSWRDAVRDRLMKLPPDTYMTAVDCHW